MALRYHRQVRPWQLLGRQVNSGLAEFRAGQGPDQHPVHVHSRHGATTAQHQRRRMPAAGEDDVQGASGARAGGADDQTGESSRVRLEQRLVEHVEHTERPGLDEGWSAAPPVP
ncbi:hypothetical protein SY2F82_41920 [Streptomyces sp. Y2F8-2]|nr:hypothetical protein SY2F82_41920 [Streptomyces sp. Y2F8-2]